MELGFVATRGSLTRVAFIVLAICGSDSSRAVEYFTGTCDAQYLDCTATAPVGCADTAVAVPNYGGCCGCRSNLFGDCRGCRSCWAENGVTVVADHTHFYYGVTSGGLEREFRYGGRGDYVFNFDFDKLCDHKGLFLKLRAEHRFGEPISSATGAFLPANISANLPVSDSEDLYLTNVLFTQFLSESFGVFTGKLDTLDGDSNAFAHGRGKTQFSNLAFVANPALLRTIPYSTLGAGFVILREGQPYFTYTLLNSRDTVRTSGFDELFAEGVAMNAELMLPTNFGGLPGRQLFGANWNSRDFVSLGQDPRIVLPDVPIAESSGSWSLYWNTHQYLVVDPCDPTHGWGIFGRAAIADDATNPIAWFLSLGVGGSSGISGREQDTFGAGWYYSGTSDEIGPLLEFSLGPLGDGQGVELFYNIAVTPWLHVTPDLQVLIPARENVDTALIAGIRAKMDF